MNKKIWAGVFAASMLFSMSGYAMAGEINGGRPDQDYGRYDSV